MSTVDNKIFRDSRGIFLLLFLLIVIFTNVTAQKNKPVPRGSLFWLKDGSFFKGQLIDNSELAPWKVRIITGDTLNITNEWTRKVLLPSQVNLFHNSSYQIKNGMIGIFSFGVSNNHVSLDLGIAHRFRDKYEVGVGVGYHSNNFAVNINRDWYSMNIGSIPLYLQGRYYFNQNKNRLYAKGRIGIANNIRDWDVLSIRPGIMGDLGIGIEFATKTPSKYFIEITQYTSNSKGVGRFWNWDQTGNGETSNFDFNAWHHRIVISAGINFGR